MKRIVFAGVGALGSNAVVLCRNLAVQLVLVDFDRVESKNCLSQAFVKQSVGKGKAEALKLQLSNFWGIKAESFGVRIGEDNVATLCGTADLVVDTSEKRRTRAARLRAAVHLFPFGVDYVTFERIRTAAGPPPGELGSGRRRAVSTSRS